MSESQGEKYSRLVKQINIPPSQLNTPFGRLALKLKEYTATPSDISTLNSIKSWFTFLPTGTAIVCGIAAYRFTKLIQAFTKFKKVEFDRKGFEQELFSDSELNAKQNGNTYQVQNEDTQVQNENAQVQNENTLPQVTGTNKIVKVNQYGDVVEEDPKI
ncbi:hypothetical protein HK103_003140 [Boothiomyces macroporosus]|uniref:Uncharacterized protein n=1 Tax=Boothiomyces macroporosus TaxID=261099 RepID=A0AAD5UMS1_9FUNG|nr:hypothetical protein HK103_003140 [Boothiomyces macroporosus]